MKQLRIFAAILLLFACNKDNGATTTATDTSGFAKGADISWITEMESSGKKFYNAAGTEMDGIRLLQSLGMNAIRLRVWVNPADGWCNKNDLLVKAYRAKSLGMRIMIDFHYSDSWADPSQQTKPAAWANMGFDELKKAVANHTTEVLTLLKEKGITPEWVQVGNETGNGMLWEDGKASSNMAQYAALTNAGYDAVKATFPDAKVIVHLQNGNDNSLFRWLFDGLKSNGGKWDVIGMSLYPTKDNWAAMNTACYQNMQDMVTRYGSSVMICEVGMDQEQATTAKAFLADLIAKSKSVPDNKVLGIFYWEPEAYGAWKNYTMGAFDDSGKPTVALDAFK
ncbi:glycoside hydrolase family 53 protein [Chitinophaga sancti]|uniref:Arabinogalactan endo-beta-1,4-galactanase n=1 Tax=Chitinophaga sancti TaxID=1004 RepID=A0A1K1SUG4_9BACT|nr:glycosyl hydrolase 53 family protein [Chitinophaga sancti]WQD60828.1 glycosyl hydrolase 53 family protein [Chitinophaga sancti]WQG87044.1 glycosyl hydrolase 53 family protein [Chitinophaga sancti]SFW87703.1 arabinogalactan endo-1,4-beta-galactosidase [Chitinophaga sancti]